MKTAMIPPAEADAGPPNLFKARYGVLITAMKNYPVTPEHGVYLSTFQAGRGQHITALETRLARSLGERLIALADEVDSEAGAISSQRQNPSSA